MKHISPNVYIEDRFSVPPPPNNRGANLGFVTTSEGIVLIDPPMLPTDAVKWRDEIAKRGEVRYIINTDQHVDHISGNSFFPGTAISHEEVIREVFTGLGTGVCGSERIEEVLANGLDAVGYLRLLVGERDPEGLALLEDFQLKAPAITFSERLNLYVGEHTFELMHLPGHTQSQIGVYIPQEKVFFAGDNVTVGTQPSLANCLPLEWVKSMEKIEAVDIDVVVPGHGTVSDRSGVRECHLFLQRCIDMVTEAIERGMSKEEAADTISFEAFSPGKRRGLAVHPGSAMQRLNVFRLYEMLSQ
jgi:glyoxylase-like metal-dependent hydrolase (beta-lactamase superfamily II)